MNLFGSPYYQIGVFFNKLTSPVAVIISFLFGFFSKSFVTVLIGVAFAALIDTLIIDIWITKSSTGMYLKNQGTWWQYHYFMSFGASCLIGFLTYFLRSKSENYDLSQTFDIVIDTQKSFLRSLAIRSLKSNLFVSSSSFSSDSAASLSSRTQCAAEKQSCGNRHS